ncbi:hypothetical protein PMAC_002107 [Pneumocystis sp. 'macacae']|nr:hypothetical protein PMAC_002107 [Pneumocystis sp. 'macacae']
MRKRARPGRPGAAGGVSSSAYMPLNLPVHAHIPHSAPHIVGHTGVYAHAPPLSAPTGPAAAVAREAPVKRPRIAGNVPVRKAFSDFRLAKLQIGSFVSDEMRAAGDQRDARIRFYFRSAADKEPSEDMSPVAATLAAPDRLSVSFKKGAVRMVISTEHIISVVFLRREGRIVVETDGWAVFEELVSNGSSQPAFRLTNTDPTNGELWRAKKIEAWLNRTAPLTEPKWTKGNLRDHIDGVSKFHGLMHILDADPCPTLQGILEQWTRLSAIGLQSERLLFQRSRLCKLDKLLDIFSELLRPDSVLTAPTNAILNIIRTIGSGEAEMTKEMLLEKVKQALFLIPEHLILKSLDVMFKKELDDVGPENVCSDTNIDSMYERQS